MEVIRKNSTGRVKFSKNFLVFDIEMSQLRNLQCSRHAMFARKLRDFPVWNISTVDDSALMIETECSTLNNEQKIGKRRE